MKKISLFIVFIMISCNEKQKVILDEYDIVGSYQILTTQYDSVKGKATVYVIDDKTNVDIKMLLPYGWSDVTTVSYEWFLYEKSKR